MLLCRQLYNRFVSHSYRLIDGQYFIQKAMTKCFPRCKQQGTQRHDIGVPRTHGPTYCHDINQSVLSLYQLPLNYNGLCITVGSKMNGADIFSMFMLLYKLIRQCKRNNVSMSCSPIKYKNFCSYKKKRKNRTISLYKIISKFVFILILKYYV